MLCYTIGVHFIVAFDNISVAFLLILEVKYPSKNGTRQECGKTWLRSKGVGVTRQRLARKRDNGVRRNALIIESKRRALVKMARPCSGQDRVREQREPREHSGLEVDRKSN
jgi:hypothetical protein